MLDDTLNSNTTGEVVHPQTENSNSVEEVVHPQTENSNSVEEVVHPQEGILTPEDIDNMSSDEFARYLSESDYTPDAAEVTEEETDSNSASDEESANQTGAESETVVQEETPAAPFKTFNTEEEYEAEVGKRINSSIRQRMRKHNEQAAKYSKLEHMAKEYYPNSHDSLSELTADLEEQAAERAEIPVEEYRQRQNDARDAQLYRERMQRETEAAREQEKIINGWQRDAEQIKYINPDFNLNEAVKNPVFAKMLGDGKTVFEAYAATNKPAPPKAPARKPILQNGASPGGGTGSRQASNPANLPSAEFKKYIEECRNGRR
ncbi:MAG: hypothetical protein IJC09_06150 [Clostridia bacterium]|nr:hypothetical protein [Clostridia bacterium]